MKNLNRARLSVLGFGMALGLLCGAGMLIVTLLAWNGQYLPFTTDMVTKWSHFLPGISLSLVGSLVAGAWGFLKGFFSGLIFAWIYNLCLCCCSKCCACCKCTCTSCGPKSL